MVMVTGSAKKLIFVLIGSIFIGELLIHVALSTLPTLPNWIESLLDPTFLSIFCFPLLYFYVFLPMASHISEQNQTEIQLRVAAAAFETHDGIMVMDSNFSIMRVNRAFEQITGYSEAEVIGKNQRILQSGLHDQAFYEVIWKELLSKGIWNGELWDRSKCGDIYPKQCTITAVRNDKGETTQYVAVFTNIAERKKAENEIYNLAFYDVLTGLPNRRLLLDRLDVALSASGRTRQYGALLFLDLDNFKTLNDTLGNEYGDILLIEVASRLKFIIKEADTVARVGGDEFVVLLENISSSLEDASQKVEQIAEKIRVILTEPYRLNENIRHTSASIGLCLFYDHNELVDDLLMRADMASYQAKSTGRNKVCFYDPQLHQILGSQAELESDLRAALREGQLELYYQIQLDQYKNPIGAEALVRWIHPKLGMVFPVDFIPIAEESSLILEVGHWVLNAACQQIAKWSKVDQTCNLVLAVNISAQQFMQPDFVEKIASLLQKYSIKASRLKLELTESVVLDELESVVTKMHSLRDVLGVTLSLDDFGTGYSSLSYLKLLPLDQIKIDQSFVRDMTTNTSDAKMVKNIIKMAHNFGLNVIAEGVDNEAQLSLLKKYGCLSYQGYLFSRPIPIEKFELFLFNSPLISA
jgi:diguanylate cyclase (GGDEF)-like protein/PAS domain S-box-containing protein